MPVNHEAVATYPTSAPPSKIAARNMAVRRMPYVLADTDDSRDLVAIDPDTGAAVVDILYLGRVFHYDQTDSTTDHDGVTCLVSYENRRYKLSDGENVLAYSVLADDLEAPPDDPDIGDAYIVAAAATGDWAGHDGEIAVYTAREWEFAGIGIGRLVYIEGRDTYVHKTAAGDLVDGFGTQSIGADTIGPSSIIGRPLRWIVVNRTTNDPPPAAKGLGYVIGPFPTGDWAGNASKIAFSEDGATWTIFTPRAGEAVFDVSLKNEFFFDGTAWVATSGAWVAYQSTALTTTSSVGAPSGVNYAAYGPTIPPGVGQRRTTDSVTLTYAARRTGSTLRFRYSANVSYQSNGLGSTPSNPLIAIYRDTDAAALSWKIAPGAAEIIALQGAVNGVNINLDIEFTVQTTDTLPHEYYIAAHSFCDLGTGTNVDATLTRRRLTLEESA